MTDIAFPALGLSLLALHDITSQQRYGVEYQPIIHAESGEIAAYEALARIHHADGTPVPPADFFHALHSNPLLLHKVEGELKQQQIDFSPADQTLFLNVDPHALLPGKEGECRLVDTIATHPRAVVELIENADIHHARAGEALHGHLAQRGIRSALDDIGAPHTLLSLELLSRVDYLKFDRSWLPRLHRPPLQQLFCALLDFARQCGKETVLEGVETEAMLEQAKRLGIDYVQGFLYRPLFIAR